MRNSSNSAFASFSEISSKMPFRIRSVGYAELPPERKIPPRILNSVELFWCLKGSCRFIFPEGEYILRPGEVCYYLPGDTHLLQIAEEGFSYRWVAFEGSQALNFWQGFRLERIPHYAGECPEELFEKLIVEVRKPGDRAILQSLNLGLRLLVESVEKVRPREKSVRSDHAELAKVLIDSEFSQPNTNVNMVAQSLGIHRVSLNRLFNARFGIPVSKYLIFKRMQFAIFLLCSTGIPVKNISMKAGFSDSIYFTRSFRRLTRRTPTRFREVPPKHPERFFPSAFLRTAGSEAKN